MERTEGDWTVIDRDAGVLVREYVFGNGSGRANCFAARLPNGQMLVLSPASGLDEAAYSELLAFGELGVVVAINGFHHLGLEPWCERFPNARFFAPSSAIRRIEKKSAFRGALEPLSAAAGLFDDDVRVVELEATRMGETYAWAKVADGYAWYTSDLVVNIERLPANPVAAFLFKVTKSAPGLRIFHLAGKVMLKKPKRTYAELAKSMRAHTPRVLVPGHGRVIDRGEVAARTIELLEAAAR
jgi:hypothetical protein